MDVQGGIFDCVALEMISSGGSERAAGPSGCGVDAEVGLVDCTALGAVSSGVFTVAVEASNFGVYVKDAANGTPLGDGGSWRSRF